MRVPRLDLRVEDAELAADIQAAIARVVAGGQFIGGTEVSSLEDELAFWIDRDHPNPVPFSVVTCASGTDALTLACLAARPRHRPPGTAVMPALSFSATASAALQAGLRIRFVDIDPRTLLIDWDEAETLLRSDSVAIPVHLYGRIARPPGGWPAYPPTVFDACQAFGIREAVTLGQFAALSFFPSKPLGCYGDGGAVVCPATYASHVRMLAHHGAKRRYVSDVPGFNSRLDTIQAAILRVKLQHVERARLRRALIARTYDAKLSDLEWLELPELVADHTWHCYVVRVKRSRDDLLAHLHANGVDAVVQYPVPLHKQPAFADFGGSFPHAEQACGEILGLPIWAGMTDAQIQFVIESVRRF
jgi:dTDP-4-amino-4,6-dideoxygalactose transaminase